MATQDIAFDKGLPSNPYAERLVLGSILLKDSAFIVVASALRPEDYSLEKHRRIFQRMIELNGREERIDRVTIANELMKHGELESCGGLGYLVSLDEGLPEIYNLESYVQIVKDKSLLRQMIFSCQEVIHRCMIGEDEPDRILSAAEDTMLKLGEDRAKESLVSAASVLDNVEGGINAFLDPSHRIKGVATGLQKLDEMTGGLHGGELFILAARPSMGKTALALNIAQRVACDPKNPKGVAIFSLEMSKESLLTRLICAQARVDQQKFRMGYLNQEERRRLSFAASEIIEAPIFIDDTSATTMMDINAKLRKLRNHWKARRDWGWWWWTTCS